MRRAHVALLVLLAVPAALAAEPPGRGQWRHAILQASGPLTPEDRQELAAKGYVVQRSLADGRYLARVGADAAVDARVTRVQEISPADKISPSARREAVAGRTRVEINVYFHEDVAIDGARAILLDAGASLEDPFVVSFAPSQRLTVRIAPSQLRAVAEADEVLVLTGPVRFEVASDNAETAALSHVPEVYAAPYGLSGQGVTVSLFELGAAQSDHVEFGSRMSRREGVTGGSTTNIAHATHVAGTIGASGVNPAARGMAPAVSIIQFCVRASSNQCRNDWLQDKKDQLAKIGSRTDNNSWGFILGWKEERNDLWVWSEGQDYFGAYELELVSPVDDISLESDVLFVHSAGNDGSDPDLGAWSRHRHVDSNLQTIRDKVFCYSANGSGTDCPTDGTTCTSCETVRHHSLTPWDTIGLLAAAKNVITVGALSGGGGTVNVAGFSSRGPAKDGRVKPDVVMRGVNVLSTVPVNAYGSNNGTSMAAPAVTGVAALLVEQWRRTFSTNPDPVQLKAVIIAGAEDLGPVGPDYAVGFGLVNAKASADLIRLDEGTGRRIRTVSIANAGREEVPLIVSTAQNLRVVLQWGDPAIPLTPGRFIADKALVNDLDLKVIGPDGAEHLPYVLDKSRPEAAAARGVNTVDNTEVLEIANAAAGTYRVMVSGTSVPEGPQRAVVVSNVRTAAPCTDITEPNDNSNEPYGPLVPGQTVYAALCTQDDHDWFRWSAVPGRDMTVTVTTGDTPIRILTASTALPTVGSTTIAANRTETMTFTVPLDPTTFTIGVEAAGPVGAEPFYSFTPNFKQANAPRRRSTRH